MQRPANLRNPPQEAPYFYKFVITIIFSLIILIFAVYLYKSKYKNQNIVNKTENCKYYSENGDCILCDACYELKNNKCISTAAASNCKDYNATQNALCLSCLEGYYLKNNTCFSNKDKKSDFYKCAKLNKTLNGCEVCEEGYRKNSKNICKNAGDNCVHFIFHDDEPYCIKCKDGLNSLDGNCFKKFIKINLGKAIFYLLISCFIVAAVDPSYHIILGHFFLLSIILIIVSLFFEFIVFKLIFGCVRLILR